MTAINVVFEKTRAHLLTDGAIYTGEGTPIGFTQKAMAMPGLQAALAIQGTAFAPGYLAQAYSATFLDFDDMLERVGHVMLADYQELCDLYGGHQNIKPFRLLVVGWSEEQAGPAGFAFDNSSAEGPVFALLDTAPGDWNMVPALSEEEEANLEAQNVLVGGVDFVGKFDPVRHGIPVMEAQRRMPIVPLGSETQQEVPIVGGYIVATEVSAEGISQRVIHRWNDDVGRIIEPDSFVRPKQVTPLRPPPGLNRQQRRVWEKKHGRAA